MYKVLIVDDEKEIRDGLASWSWEDLGLQVAGCCAHGLEALQFIAEVPVDIVMTDIRMPFMNGIELMEALNRQYPFISVIILSGHDDFDYAQKAIQNGAADYLLKPVQFPALAQSFEQLVRKLDAKRQAEYRMSVLKRKEEMLARVLRDDFLRRLLHFEMTSDDIDNGSSEGEVLLEGDCFTVAAYRLDRLSLHQQHVSDRELRLLAFSLDNILQDLWDARSLGYHFVNKSNAEFYLLSTSPEPYEAFTNVLPQLEKYIGLFRSTVSAGMGKQVRQPAEINRSTHSAERALRRNKEASSISDSHEEDFSVRKMTPPVISVNAAAPAAALPRENQPDSVILVNAKKYIRENYHRSLTSKEVADHVYVSPGYLSALFKEAGNTYLKFLTSIRMREAVELLNETGAKVYEIVERVGYTDPAYFSEVFKKYTGKSPNEYRGKSKQQREG